MKKTKRIFGMALLAAALQASAQSHVKALWTGDTLQLSLPLTESTAVGSDYSVWTTPALVGMGGDTLRLAPVVFRGQRNKRYVERGRYFGTAPQATAAEQSIGDTVWVTCAVNRASQPWLWGGPVSVVALREKEGCCNVAPMPQLPLGRLLYVPPFKPQLAAVEDNTGKAGELARNNPVLQHISQYKPYTDDRILRKEEGALYVHFPLDKATLLHDFRGNAKTLDDIVSITRAIMADSTSSVKIIQIIGLASVEGPVRHNKELAGNRAAALQSYIRQRVKTPASLYEAVNGGEAWTELRSQIEEMPQIPRQQELLGIIRTEKDPDKRERRIKQLDGGRPYAYLRDNVLSDQRNSGYLRIYYDYVPDTKAKVINEATELLKQERYAEALAMLRTVEGDERAHNALGVALYMTGHEEEALTHFRRAAQQGNEKARENVRQIEAIMKAKAADKE